ncbi:unnamed protein product, partial [Schistosoma margrebowiei]
CVIWNYKTEGRTDDDDDNDDDDDVDDDETNIIEFRLQGRHADFVQDNFVRMIWISKTMAGCNMETFRHFV